MFLPAWTGELQAYHTGRPRGSPEARARLRPVTVRRTLVRATAGMAAVTVVSRLSGYARDKAIAALLGAGRVADAFYAGQAVPNMFRAFLAEGALHAAFIPALSELAQGERAERQREFVRAMVSSLLVVLPAVVAVGVLGAPWLVRIFAVGFLRDAETYALAVTLTRLMFPYLGLISLAALAQGVLNANGRFILPAATPIALNLCIVAGVVTASQFLGGDWRWLAAGVVVGGAAQLAVQLPACHRLGLPLLPGGVPFRHPEVRRVLRLMLPGIPALGIYQVTLLLSYRFASTIGPGAVTWKFNAVRLNELIYGVLIVQLTTALLPMLAAERARDEAAARTTLGFALRILSLVALPSAVFLALAAPHVVGALFGGGRYTPADVAATAGALAMYAWGLPFLGFTKMMAGAAYAWKDTRAPVLAAAVNLLAFWTFGRSWTGSFGIAGLAAAASLGQALNFTVLAALNARAGRMPAAGEVLPAIARHLAAAAIMGCGLFAARPLLPPRLATGVASLALTGAAALACALVYLGVLAVLGAPEWRDLRRLLSTRRGR